MMILKVTTASPLTKTQGLSWYYWGNFKWNFKDNKSSCLCWFLMREENQSIKRKPLCTEQRTKRAYGVKSRMKLETCSWKTSAFNYQTRWWSWLCSDTGIMLKTSAFQIICSGNSNFINFFDKPKNFWCFTLPLTQHL